MGKWSHTHNCQRSDPTVPVASTNDTYVRRFSTYNAKFETMQQSYRIDCKNYKKFEVSEARIELDTQWIKIEFVTNAVEILLECRRTLMHSYVFSYFMTTIDNQMYIFEENLKYLERCTEQLSGIIENEVNASNVNTLKEKILNHKCLCTKRRRDLIDHIIEGYDKNWWRKFPIPPEELMAVDAEAIQNLLY
jgi:hypothetical protein